MASESILRGTSGLIMDDNVRIVRLVRQILELVGVAHIGEAHDGRAGFDAVCRNPYDFVIADWNMPEIDGMEFLKLVRRSETSPNPALPVLMLAANATAQEVHEAKAVGIDGYIAKPFTPALLVRRVETTLAPILAAKNRETNDAPTIRPLGID